MLIVVSPNKWSCLPAAFATVIGVSFEDMLDILGHDGSEIVYPDLPEPFNRRAFIGPEFVNALYPEGYLVSTFEFNPLSVCDETHAFKIVGTQTLEEYFEMILADSVGVIGGLSKISDTPHAVAWEGTRILDPLGFIYPLERFIPDVYFRVTKL